VTSPDPLAKKIRKARTDAALSRETLAGALDVSLATLVRYETGRTQRISAEMLIAISKATGKPLAYFLGKVAA
jgi:transcriptional regulator with XRE-family HTH domain